MAVIGGHTALLPGADKAAHPHHPPRPRRKGVATSKAKGPSFIALSESAGVPIQGPASALPFYGPNAVADKQHYQGYEYSSQALIMTALAVPLIADNIDRSEGSAPELVTLGYYLKRGWQLNIDLFWQTATFRDAHFNPSGHPFPVDIMVVRGDIWYLPVDGNYFHLRTQTAVLHDLARNALLAANVQPTHVVPIIDQPFCQSEAALDAYLRSQGAP